MHMHVEIKKLNPDAVIPVYADPGDSGFDFHCLADISVPARQTIIIPTGLAFGIPLGYELQVRLRSSASIDTPLIIANAPGTVDSGYRGEVGVVVHNLSDQPYLLKKGERIAQGVIAPVVRADFEVVNELSPTARGTGSFGSTGLY